MRSLDKNLDHLEIQDILFSSNGECVGTSSGKAVNDHNNLILFITKLRSLNLLSKSNANSTVVYADDQFVNREAMRMNFEDMDIGCNLILF